MADLDQIATTIRSKHAAGELQRNFPLDPRWYCACFAARTSSDCTLLSYEKHAPVDVKPCGECQGTGKIHETHTIGDLKGIPGADRVLERSCSHCGGFGITGDHSTKVVQDFPSKQTSRVICR
mmetsp:Transcript_35612/g.111412  ORF Transcript_35612/g.111412 Transcript_35612/m.111412 type:complete len:123 (-) Transcript_35612:436-804(-)